MRAFERWWRPAHGVRWVAASFFDSELHGDTTGCHAGLPVPERNVGQVFSNEKWCPGSNKIRF